MKNRHDILDGKICTPGLEFFAVKHCNLRCLGCAQGSPFIDQGFADLSTFTENLFVLGKYLKPKKITILGGEPLLHPEIASIAEIARKSGIFDKICITTNGLLLGSMPQLFWENVDAIRVSVYPTTKRTLDMKWAEFEAKSLTTGVHLERRMMPVFQEIVKANNHNDSDLVAEIFKQCVYKYYCHTLFDGFFYRCSPIVHMAEYLYSKGLIVNVSDCDRLKVDGSQDFGTKLAALILREEPLSGCEYCWGTSGASFAHRQLSTEELQR